MPKYFRNQRQKLHYEAIATLILISARLQAIVGETEYGYNQETLRLMRLQEKAHARVYRRM